MGMTAHALAMALHVPAPRINDIVRQRRSITADTAMRLGRFFGMSAEFWMGLQADFDMARARDALAADLAAIRPWQAPQAA
jgi:antitoxin HigA-1